MKKKNLPQPLLIHPTVVWVLFVFVWLLLSTPKSHCLLAAVAAADDDKAPQDNDVCRGGSSIPNMTMVLKDCASGPFGLANRMRHELVHVFGHVMCYSLDYGYLSYADLQDYQLLYVDASGAGDFDTVTDWFLHTGSVDDDNDNHNNLMHQFVQRGQHVVWFNAAAAAAPLLDLVGNNQAASLYPLALGATLQTTTTIRQPPHSNNGTTAPWDENFYGDDNDDSTLHPYKSTFLGSLGNAFETILYQSDFDDMASSATTTTTTTTTQQQPMLARANNNRLFLSTLTPRQMQGGGLRKRLLRYMCRCLQQQQQQSPLLLAEQDDDLRNYLLAADDANDDEPANHRPEEL